MTADNVIDGELSTYGWNSFAYVHNNDKTVNNVMRLLKIFFPVTFCPQL